MDAAEAIAKLMDGEQVQDGWLSECLSRSGLKNPSFLNEDDILQLEPSAVKNLINEFAGLAPAVDNLKEALSELKKTEENLVFLEKKVENAGGRNKERVADMRGSLKILTELDSAIKQKTIELFSDAFARVKEAFSAEFQKIITGGDAELRLSTPDDVYESGIEVYARFPDKDMVHSSCLSFREKTIAAFVLVLAMQKHPINHNGGIHGKDGYQVKIAFVQEI